MMPSSKIIPRSFTSWRYPIMAPDNRSERSRPCASRRRSRPRRRTRRRRCSISASWPGNRATSSRPGATRTRRWPFRGSIRRSCARSRPRAGVDEDPGRGHDMNPVQKFIRHVHVPYYAFRLLVGTLRAWGFAAWVKFWCSEEESVPLTMDGLHFVVRASSIKSKMTDTFAIMESLYHHLYSRRFYDDEFRIEAEDTVID